MISSRIRRHSPAPMPTPTTINIDIVPWTNIQCLDWIRRAHQEFGRKSVITNKDPSPWTYHLRLGVIGFFILFVHRLNVQKQFDLIRSPILIHYIFLVFLLNDCLV